MDLMKDCLWLAGRWAEEQSRVDPSISTTTLGFRVAQDSKLFPRLEGGATMTIKLFERLVAYLADAGNWPEKRVPQDVLRKFVQWDVDLSSALGAVEAGR